MDLTFFPQYYATSLCHAHFLEAVDAETPMSEVLLQAQLSVNNVLSTLCGASAPDGVADTFVSYNPSLYEAFDYQLFSVVVQLAASDGEVVTDSACVILFKRTASAVEVVRLWK